MARESRGSWAARVHARRFLALSGTFSCPRHALYGLIHRMRAAALLRPGNVARAVANFQRHVRVEWTSLVEQADVAVLFGGDGTLHRHLATLVELEIPLLVVPCGSGNDFARALNIRSGRDAVRAWDKIVKTGDNLRSVDLGTMPPPGIGTDGRECKYFSCIAGVGLDS